jgi:hypothetical protein
MVERFMVVGSSWGPCCYRPYSIRVAETANNSGCHRLVTTIDASALRDDCENGFQSLRCPNIPTRFKTSVRGDFFVSLSQGNSKPDRAFRSGRRCSIPAKAGGNAVISSHKHVRLEIHLRIPRNNTHASPLPLGSCSWSSNHCDGTTEIDSGMQEEWHMNNSRVDEASDSDRGHRMLYVLTASLALAVIGMIAVAIAVQSFQ